MKITKREDIEYFSKFTGICEYPDGTKYWYKKGIYHRLDGPAIEWLDGSKEWYKNGYLHREDGPALEWYDGDKEWYLNGISYTKKDYYKKLYKLRKITKNQLFTELL